MKTNELLPQLKMHRDPRLIQRAQLVRVGLDSAIRPLKCKRRRKRAIDPAQLAAEFDDCGVGRNALQAVGAISDGVRGGGDLKDEESVEHGGRVGERSVEDASVADVLVACVGRELLKTLVVYKAAERRVSHKSVTLDW